MYDPEKMKNAYDKMEHGKAKMSAIRAAVAEADRQGDVPFRMYFRMEVCHESCFYGDGMDLMVVFPELLALTDQYPDTPVTRFDTYMYVDSLDHVLWIYKWVLSHCESFYQIPMEDCLKFFEDAKERFVRYGYNLRPWYHIMYDFYKHIDQEKSEKAFHEFERLPRDLNSDCEACERNTEILFYLDRGNLKKAMALSEDIEDFTLTCGARMAAWLRMKKNFMHYYMKRKEFDKALTYCKMMERNLQEETEYERWDDFLACYAYSDLGKALKIYKEHWKEWLNWRDPADEFRLCINVCRFFCELGRSKEEEAQGASGTDEAGGSSAGTGEEGGSSVGTSAEERGKEHLTGDEKYAGNRRQPEGGAAAGEPMVRLSLDHTFPLYQESGLYSIPKLYDFYYKRAEELADKFDARNGADGYRRELEEALCTTR